MLNRLLSKVIRAWSDKSEEKLGTSELFSDGLMKRGGFAFSFKDLMSKQNGEGRKAGSCHIVIYQKAEREI